jgi:hypothetical protein
MLKYTIVCVMLVAAAAMGWGQLDDVPVNVESGAHLTWGDGFVWGMFPIQGGQGGVGQKTYALKFCPNAEPDSMWDDSTIPLISSRRLHHTGLTFQWNVQPVAWACGWHDDGENEYSKLYWYPVDSAPNEWRQDTIDTFALGEGASIAYVPNDYYHPMNYVCSGWIYCIPGGNTTSFWRYAVDGEYLPDLELYGYYPGPGAIIADQTPHFSWSSSAANQYRIQVSTSQFFIVNVIDEVLTNPEYEPSADCGNMVMVQCPQLRSGGRMDVASSSPGSGHRGCDDRVRQRQLRRRQQVNPSPTRRKSQSELLRSLLPVQHHSELLGSD